MNLSQLRFALAVASTRSFTAAAAECSVTQPTLSNSIAQLEDELGERLFLRTTRKVAPTPFGAHILPYMAQVLSAQQTLTRQAELFLHPDKRLIRIGTSPLISANLLGLMIEPFRLQNADVDIVLREMNMTDLYRMLDEGLLDFVFGVANIYRGPWNSTWLYNEPLLYIPRGVARPNGSRIRSVPLMDIADETFVMVPDGCGLARATRALFQRHRVKLHQYSGEAMSYQVLEEWAALGIGAAILPRSKVAGSGQSAFSITDKAGHEVLIGFEAAWPNKGTRSAHVLGFAEHLRKVVPGIVAGLGAGTKPRKRA